MSQADSRKQLKVKLYAENDVDYLEFQLGANNHKLNVKQEDNQSEIKALFCDLLPLLESSAIELVLDVAEEYDNHLLKEVSTSYIADLNKEIKNVRTEILDKYADPEEE